MTKNDEFNDYVNITGGDTSCDLYFTEEHDCYWIQGEAAHAAAMEACH